MNIKDIFGRSIKKRVTTPLSIYSLTTDEGINYICMEVIIICAGCLANDGNAYKYYKGLFIYK